MSDPPLRPPATLVVLFDGTLASLSEGRRSNIGRIRALLSQRRGGGPLRVHYAEGQQWEDWRALPDLALGSTMPGRIATAYGWLANSYQPGDRIFLFGYSRGAFAVRSLAGMIGRVGLLRPQAATERHIRLGWRYYQKGGSPSAIAAFRRRRCHPETPIQMIGCFDTVMALGIRLPLLWLLTEPRYRFHDQQLSPDVRFAAQALALDETRAAFQPILWASDGHPGIIRQTWFRGSHADIGGQLNGFDRARPLANIPLVWMLEQAQEAGLPLPPDWRDDLPTDAGAPSVGSWRNWGKAFLLRAPRTAGHDASESLHESVPRPYTGTAILTGALKNESAPDRATPLSPERPRRKARG